MNRWVQKVLGSSMALILCASSLAGCSSGQDKDAGMNEETKSPVQQEDTQQEEGQNLEQDGTGWEDKEITLQFWDNDTREEWQAATQAVFDGFTERHPNIKIERVMVPWNDIDTKFQASVAAGSAPDFMYGSDKFIVSWASQGSLAPLDDILDDIGRDKFEESFLKGTSTGDKSYLVPIAYFPHVVFYRKDLYEKYNLEIPGTWDELYQNAKTIQDKEPDVSGFDMLAGKGEPYTMVNFMSVNDSALLNENQEVVVNSSNTVETLQYLQKMYDLIPNGSYGKSQADVRLIAIQGGVAHHIDSVSFAGTIANEDKLDLYGAFPIPQNKGDYQAITGFYGFAVSSTDPDRLAATKELIKYMNEPDVYMEFAKSSVLGHIPANKTATQGDTYWSSERVAPFADIFKVAMDAGKNGIVMGMERGANKYSSFIVSSYIYNDMLDMLILNKDTPEKICSWAEEKMNTIIDDVDNQ